MNDERLHSIERCLIVFSKIDISTIDELISEVKTLRKLVKAVDVDYGGSVGCGDIDGKNWFDVRDEVLS